MKFKLFAMTLVVLLLASALGGCGTTTAGGGSKTLKVGIEGPFTGPSSEVGTEFKDADDGL